MMAGTWIFPSGECPIQYVIAQDIQTNMNDLGH